MPKDKGLMLVILRYADEVRDGERFFDSLGQQAEPQAVALAKELIEKQSGAFEPETMPNRYADAVRELVEAKVSQRQPDILIEPATGKAPAVVNIMQALKESMQGSSREKVSTAVRRRMSKHESVKGTPLRAKGRGSLSSPKTH